MSGNKTNPCTNNPNTTVKKYIPNLPTIAPKSSNSKTLDATKNRTPIGDNLEVKNETFNKNVK